MIENIIKAIIGYKLIIAGVFVGTFLILLLIVIAGKIMYKVIRNMQHKLWDDED